MGAARRTTLVLGATGRLGSEIARRMVGLSSTLLVHGADPAETALLGSDVALQVLPIVIVGGSLLTVCQRLERIHAAL